MKKIGLVVIFALIVFIGIKSCVKTTVGFSDYLLLERFEESGQRGRIIITPSKEMISIISYQGVDEFGIYSIEAEGVTHYFLGLYCLNDDFPLGLRYYHNAEDVFNLHLTLINKKGDSFPKVGDSVDTRIIVCPDKVKIGKAIYERLKITDPKNKEMLDLINQMKAL